MYLIIQLAAVLLGMLAGATLLIGLAIVPFWQSLSALQFANWFQANAHFIAAVMLPLGMLSAIATWLATGLAWKNKSPNHYLLIIASVCILGALLMFPLYFKSTNAAFASGLMSASQINETLAQWQFMHWGRTIAVIVGSFCAVRFLARA